MSCCSIRRAKAEVFQAVQWPEQAQDKEVRVYLAQLWCPEGVLTKEAGREGGTSLDFSVESSVTMHR